MAVEWELMKMVKDMWKNGVLGKRSYIDIIY